MRGERTAAFGMGGKADSTVTGQPDITLVKCLICKSLTSMSQLERSVLTN